MRVSFGARDSSSRPRQLKRRAWQSGDTAGILTQRKNASRVFGKAISTRFQERAGVATPREARGPDGLRPSSPRPAVRPGRRIREGFRRRAPTPPAAPKAVLMPESRTRHNAERRAGRCRCSLAPSDDWADEWTGCGRMRDAGRRRACVRACGDSISRCHCEDDRVQHNRQFADAPRRNGRSSRDGRATTTRRYWRTNSSPTRSRPGSSEKRALPETSTGKPRPTHTIIRAYAHARWKAITFHASAAAPNQDVTAPPALCVPLRTFRLRAGSGCIAPAGGGHARRFP